MRKSILSLIGVTLVVLFGQIATTYSAQTSTWPREIKHEKGSLQVHLPQIESLVQNKLSARAAVSFTVKGSKIQRFASFWFTTSLMVDKDQRLAILMDLKISKVNAPHLDKSETKELGKILKKSFPTKGMMIDLDRFISLLATLPAKDVNLTKDLKSVSPQVFFVTKETELIQINGTPKLDKIDGTPLKRIVNSEHMIILDPRKNVYYTSMGRLWFSSKKLLTGWKVTSRIPSDIQQANSSQQQSDSSARNIIITTKPSELIISQGKPIYTPFPDSNLIYIQNSDSPVFLHMPSNYHFTVFAGRWFKAPKLTTRYWESVSQEKLPPDFQKIPTDHKLANVRTYVKGTEESKEATANAMLPQSVQTKRHRASLKVTYDGKPSFKKISSTDLYYAENTATPVIKYERTYYACNKAVWFRSHSPYGTWELATSVPTEIYKIPVSSPLYYVTFVHIYSYDDEYVYGGYTPGYTGTYIYENTVVYGTGYVYPYWYHHHYYSHRHTYGARFYYNSNTGNWYGHIYSRCCHHSVIRIDKKWAKERKDAFREWYNENKGKITQLPNHNKENLKDRLNNVDRDKVKDRVRNISKEDRQKAREIITSRDGKVFKNEDGTWKVRDKNKWKNTKLPSQNVLRDVKSRERARQNIQKRQNLRQRTPTQLPRTPTRRINRGGVRRR